MIFKKSIKSISSDEVIAKGIKNIVDVREVEEYIHGHIPYAINMPLSTFQSYQGEEPVYVICQSGMRSKQATKLLINQGIDAINIEGGMNSWTGEIK